MDNDVRDTQASQEHYPAGERNEQDEAESAAQRQAALRALAQSATQRQATSATPPTRAAARAPTAGAADGRSLTPRGPKRGARRGVVIGGAVVAATVIIALIAVVLAHLAGARPTTNKQAAPPVAKPIVRINPLGDGLICVQQLAWSPDSAQIAVLGNTQVCGPSAEGAQTTGIYLYDARTGKLAQQLQPDGTLAGSTAVQDAIAKSESNAYNTPEISYTDLVWTPDGKALLLPYQIETSAPNDKVATYVTGLLRVGLHSSTLNRIWLDTTHPQQTGAPERWDLTTGTPVTLPPPGAASAYDWASDGSLAMDTAPADGAIGNTAGGQSFSVWQPGYLLYQQSQGNLAATGTSASTPVKGNVGWSPTIMPLSPDGRYFYAYFAYALDTFYGLTPPATQGASPSAAPIAPHDKALLALAQQMTQATGDLTQQPGYAVAWRPDGKQMAAVSLNVNPAQPGTAPSALTVSIYDTASGQVVKQLTPDWTGLSTGNASRETVIWSPDGKRLLLEDNVFGAITIWGPGALPA